VIRVDKEISTLHEPIFETEYVPESMAEVIDSGKFNNFCLKVQCTWWTIYRNKLKRKRRRCH